MHSWLKMDQTQQKPKWTNKEQVIKNSNEDTYKYMQDSIILSLMVESFKEPTMSACSVPNPCSIPSSDLYLREATKNSHSKEIGDWHSFQLPTYTAWANQSSKHELRLLKKTWKLWVCYPWPPCCTVRRRSANPTTTVAADGFNRRLAASLWIEMSFSCAKPLWKCSFTHSCQRNCHFISIWGHSSCKVN